MIHADRVRRIYDDGCEQRRLVIYSRRRRRVAKVLFSIPLARRVGPCNCLPNGPVHRPTCPAHIDGSQRG